MKNDTTFVRMRSGDHLGDPKMSKKGHLARAPSNLTFLIIAIDRNGFRRMKEEGLIYKTCLRFFNFCLETYTVYDLSKFSDDFTPFLALKDHN